MSKLDSPLMRKLAPNLERPSVRWYVWVGFLSILILFGLYALGVLTVIGEVVTGVRDNAVWGIYTANLLQDMKKLLISRGQDQLLS